MTRLVATTSTVGVGVLLVWAHAQFADATTATIIATPTRLRFIAFLSPLIICNRYEIQANAILDGWQGV
jgi:hypothetical protein